MELGKPVTAQCMAIYADVSAACRKQNYANFSVV